MNENGLTPGLPVMVCFHCNEVGCGALEGSAYRVEYRRASRPAQKIMNEFMNWVSWVAVEPFEVVTINW